jgi:hypothetical protein
MMKPIVLLDESLQIEIYFDNEDCDLDDNICLKITESCQDDEKIFRHDESHLFMTRAQAEEFANALLEAVQSSRDSSIN